MSIELKQGDCLEVMRTLPSNSIDTCITDPPYALEFMGKGWDKVLPSVEVWREVLRVLKPGAMLMAFGGTRTFHRLTTSIEDAGFEIRDCMMWLYGQGFPKSLDISKAIDKANGTRKIVGKVEYRSAFNSSGTHQDFAGVTHSAEMEVTEPGSDAARTWNGYGTALKPAWEPIILAMKPLEGTFAENAHEWGVAGLNIDAGRIGIADAEIDLHVVNASKPSSFDATQDKRDGVSNHNLAGRWPANVLLDEEAVEMLGEPSRFFYTAKASASERNAGLEGVEPKRASSMPGRRNADNMDGFKTDNDVTGRFVTEKRNHHPTVKPLALMEYLCKLTRTPTGGVVLDPFMGSGTTGLACVNTGRSFIGIEIDAGYFAIAEKRVPHGAPCDVHALRSAGESLPSIARKLKVSVPEVARMLRGAV